MADQVALTPGFSPPQRQPTLTVAENAAYKLFWNRVVISRDRFGTKFPKLVFNVRFPRTWPSEVLKSVGEKKAKEMVQTQDDPKPEQGQHPEPAAVEK